MISVKFIYFKTFNLCTITVYIHIFDLDGGYALLALAGSQVILWALYEVSRVPKPTLIGVINTLGPNILQILLLKTYLKIPLLI